MATIAARDSDKSKNFGICFCPYVECPVLTYRLEYRDAADLQKGEESRIEPIPCPGCNEHGTITREGPVPQSPQRRISFGD